MLVCCAQTAASCKAKGAPACDTHGVDLSQMSQLRKFTADVLDKYKSVDVLVNNAGMGAPSGMGPIEGTPLSLCSLVQPDGLPDVCPYIQADSECITWQLQALHLQTIATNAMLMSLFVVLAAASCFVFWPSVANVIAASV